MSKVFIGVGHGGSDPGAVSGNLKEADMNLVMATACKDELIRHGVSVKMSRTKDENDNVSEEIKKCNEYNPDLAIDIHNNSGGGDGFEVFYSNGSKNGKELAEYINEEVKNIGQNSRGVKTKLTSTGKDYFGFVRETKCPSVIVEGVFIDSNIDMQIAHTIDDQKKFGIAYAKGILKKLGIEYVNQTVSQNNSSSDQTLFAVSIGAWANKSTADAKVEELKKKGYTNAYLSPR